MRHKIWNWTILVVMCMSIVVSTIAAYSHEWDKASYFAILILIAKFSIDEDEEIW